MGITGLLGSRVISRLLCSVPVGVPDSCTPGVGEEESPDPLGVDRHTSHHGSMVLTCRPDSPVYCRGRKTESSGSILTYLKKPW